MDYTIVSLSPMLIGENIQCFESFQPDSRADIVMGRPRFKVLSIAGREFQMA